MSMNFTAADRDVLRRYAIEARDEFLQRQAALLRRAMTWTPGSYDHEDLVAKAYRARSETEGFWPVSNHSALSDTELRDVARQCFFEDLRELEDKAFHRNRAAVLASDDIPW